MCCNSSKGLARPEKAKYWKWCTCIIQTPGSRVDGVHIRFKTCFPTLAIVTFYYLFFLHCSQTKIYEWDKKDLQITKSAYENANLKKKNVNKPLIELGRWEKKNDAEIKQKAQKKMRSEPSHPQLLLLFVFLRCGQSKIYNWDKKDLPITNNACKKCGLEKKNDINKTFIEIWRW